MHTTRKNRILFLFLFGKIHFRCPCVYSLSPPPLSLRRMASSTHTDAVQSLTLKMETMKVTTTTTALESKAQQNKRTTWVDKISDALLNPRIHNSLNVSDTAVVKGIQAALSIDVYASNNKRKLQMGSGFVAYTKAEFEMGAQMTARAAAQQLNFFAANMDFQLDVGATLKSAKWCVCPIPPHKNKQYVTVVYSQ
jgi:hypothetical protein